MPTINSERVLNYLKEHYGTEMTKNEIAEALSIPLSAVTGSINALVKKGHYVERVETIEIEPATETKKAKMKDIRYGKLSESGLEYDPVADEKAKKAASEALKAQRKAEKAALKAEKDRLKTEQDEF